MTEFSAASVVPTSTLKQLKVHEIKPSTNNPRTLFDREPLNELKASIAQHGVLVPITVYKIKGQEKYFILDGERRYKCCLELEDEGKEISIPANIVDPPNKIAGLLYMFSIHSFREEWELMPTALSLQTIMEELKERDTKKLSKLTGLSTTSIERCKILLSFDKKYQEMSLNLNPQERIPSNFWIEAYPVINLYEEKVPEEIYKIGKEQVTDRLVQKYRDQKIVSIIHFRRIVEAKKRSEEKGEEDKFNEKLVEYISKPELETRDAFDDFLPKRSVKTALNTIDDFIERIKKVETELITEMDIKVIEKLKDTQAYISQLLEKIGQDSDKYDE